MSKWIAFLAVPAVGALAAWNLSLSSEIDALRDEVSRTSRPTTAASRSEKPEAGRAGAESRPIVGRANPDSGLFEGRIDTIEKRLMALTQSGPSVN